MRAVLLLLLMPAAAHAQQLGVVERGAQLFRTNCATPYCHGPDGTAGRAPRLAGHRFNVNTTYKIVTWGIPGTSMPEFTTRLTTQEIADVAAYVMTLAGSTTAAPAGAAAAPPRELPPEARPGRALFFDAARTGACGSCHELDGWGVPIGPDLASLPAGRLGDPGAITARNVVTVRPRRGEAFPAVVVERSAERVRVYDLTGPLPVLHSLVPSQVTLEPGSPWRHEQAVRIYTRAELDAIALYLRQRAGP